MKKAINSLCITALVLAVMGVVDQKESLAQTSPITGYIGDLSDLILDLVLSDGVDWEMVPIEQFQGDTANGVDWEMVPTLFVHDAADGTCWYLTPWGYYRSSWATFPEWYLESAK